jgi:hypothetical protein
MVLFIGEQRKFPSLHVLKISQVRETMSDRRSEMSTRINVTVKEAILGSSAIEAHWDVRKVALGYTPPSGDEESGSFEPFDASVLHRASPSEWAEGGSKYIPSRFLLSNEIMRVRMSFQVVYQLFESLKLKIRSVPRSSTEEAALMLSSRLE